MLGVLGRRRLGLIRGGAAEVWSLGFGGVEVLARDGLNLLLRGVDKAQGAAVVREVVVLIAIERPDGFGDMVARVGYRELVGMPASAGKTVANLSAGCGRGLRRGVSTRGGS